MFDRLLMCACDCVVFFPFLIKPLVRFGEQVVPRRPLNFFMNVVDRSVNERRTTVDDAEVGVVLLIIQRLILMTDK